MIFCKAKEDKKILEVYVYGEITGDDWLECDTLNTVKREVKEFEGEAIDVHINSYGGDVSGGIAICNFLKDCKAKVRTIVDGFACSSASLVFMAGDERKMNDGTLLMIHKPWSLIAGDSEKMKKTAETLDKIESSLIEIYKRGFNGTDEELKSMIDDETWMDGEEAVKHGFATVSEKASAKNVSLEKFVAKMDLSNHKEEPPAEPEPIPANKLFNIFGKNW